MEYLHESFSINKVISEVVFDFELQVNEKWQSIITQINKTKDLFLVSDKNKIRQCIINLVSNAYKYNKKNGTITIKTSVQDNCFILDVIDTWIWISKDHIEIIFEKFWQIKNSLTRDIDGTWLWLSIVKWFVEKLWWKIEVKSELGIWSTFTLYVPIK
jgi:signal transduction histidine kinase